MPIRFRCAYCSQLMGIARRKAGTVVSCPTCHGQVVVPDPGPGSEETNKGDDNGGAPPLFESSDFDQIFGNPGAVSAPAAAPAPPAGPPLVTAPVVPAPPPPASAAPPQAQPEITFDVERPGRAMETARAGQTGIWLSPTAMTLLCLFVILLLALSFVAGLLVGRSIGG
jgi:hypothetical protein